MLLQADPTPAELDLEAWAAPFEEAWQERPEPSLASFLPENDHPHYCAIACELVCIDIELRWTHSCPKPLATYREEFPKLFAEPEWLRQIAFEDYRQRVQAGDGVAPAEYERRFSIDASQWPNATTIGSRHAPAPTIRIHFNGSAPSSGTDPDALAVLRRSGSALAKKVDAAAEALPEVGSRFLNFTLVEQLGRGSFAKVFLARQPELADRLVALKISVDLKGEPQKLARLQHTNIVPIYSVHEVGNLQAVCMPFLGSTTLGDVLDALGHAGHLPHSGREFLSTLYDHKASTLRSREIAPACDSPATIESADSAAPILDLMQRLSHIDAVLWLAARITDGLAHAHDRGILHRDLKPANILLTDDGQPMLLDFNLSLDISKPGARETAFLGGTFPYMAPEHLEGCITDRKTTDERSDLYALGIIFFEMLTGRYPFAPHRGTIDAIVPPMIAERRRGAPSPRAFNPAIPRAADSIIRKLLDPDPARRYQRAADLRDDIERQLAHQPLKFAPDPSIPERWRKWKKRHPRAAAATVASVLVGLFLILPASLYAIHQSDVAERRLRVQTAEAERRSQIEVAEAKQTWHERGKEARTAQLLLATRTGDRALLNRGLDTAKAVLDRYGIGTDDDWTTKPLFARLPAEQQSQLRSELADMLLLMARAEQIRCDAKNQSGLAAALRWNQLADEIAPAGPRPQTLARQRVELLRLLPDEATRVPALVVDSQNLSEFDAYHEGVACAMAGRYRDALQWLKPFAEEHPQHYSAWFVRGICHDHLGQYHDAVAAFTVCISLESNVSWAFFNRGIARLHLPDYRGAEADFTRTLERQGDHLAARLHRAIARKGMKQFAAAIEDLDQILLSEDAPVRAWFLRGEVNGLLGNRDDANRDRAEVLKRQPADELSWSTRGYARMESEPAEALKDFDAAIAINPRSRDALLNKSIVLSESLNKPREAVAALDRLLEFYPDDVAAIGGRGVLLARLGETAKARRDAQECLLRERSPFYLFQMAGLYAQLSKHEKNGDARAEALRLLGNALRNGFKDVELLKSDADLEPVRNDPAYQRLADAAMRLNRR